jgi:hypothetical protein
LTALQQTRNLATADEAESSANVLDQIRVILHKQLQTINCVDSEIGMISFGLLF